VIVPQAPGGANDAIARIVEQKLTEQTGQQFLVDNKPGAGGNIGTAAAAKSKPDGYTLLLTVNSAHVINPSLYKSAGFHPVKDFEPITPVANAGYVLVANNNFPPKNVAELIAAAKAQPAKIAIASAGNGTPLDWRDAGQGRRHRPDARALQGRLGRGDGPGERPGEGLGAEPSLVDIVHQERQAEGAGRGEREARGRAA
jgi:hypothetical protein